MQAQGRIVRNTLFSPRTIEALGELEAGLEAEAVFKIFDEFKGLREFGTEIHTENSFVKPILRLLGFPYESKPRFFEPGIKDPDYALFATEGERKKAGAFWGQSAYYDYVLALVLLKRYGRNLWEGVSGYFLEFERRIPFYQLLYLLKKSPVKWGILTNGARWILVKRPVLLEKRFIEIDLEGVWELRDRDTFRLFSVIFSPRGLKELLPELEERERHSILGLIRKEQNLWPTSAPRTDDEITRFVDGLLRECDLNASNLSEVCLHLLVRGERKEEIRMEKVLPPAQTKEALLSTRILDMTPNFGAHFVQLVDGISYLCSNLPYKDPSKFVPEWEEERSLLDHITGSMLFGIERSELSLEILRRTSKARYGVDPRNYKKGDPLLGVPLASLLRLEEEERQPSLFFENVKEALNRFIDLRRQALLLSDRIKEELAVKEGLEGRLRLMEERIRDILDAYLATYFFRDVERGHVLELLLHLGDAESFWQKEREKEWLKRVKAISKKRGFFHMELEFPFLFLQGFDIVIVNPGSHYPWEQQRPFLEVTKAYIKRATPYVKREGRIVLLTEAREDVLSALFSSKRYEVRPEEGFILLTLKDQSPSHPQQ